MSNLNRVPDEDFVCPHCGAKVVAGATFCRQCGASDESGWNTQDGLFGEADGYSPDDDFDYDEFISREFPEEASPLSKHVLKRLAVTLVALLAGLALLLWQIL